MMGYRFGMMGFGFVGFILLIALVGLVVYAIVKAADNSGRQRYSSSYDDTRKAMDILNQRLANGEIDEEEYKRKKDLLKQ